jgi:hypothetical protein
MADDADLAQQISEQIIELQTKNRVVARMDFTGFCYNCESPVKHAALFCDKDCRDDYEHRERMSLQNGKSA